MGSVGSKTRLEVLMDGTEIESDGMTPISRFNDPEFVRRITEICKQILDSGGNIEDVLLFLKETSNRQTPAIKIISGLLNISISQAKGIVNSSETWSSEREAHERLMRDADRAFDELEDHSC